MKDEATDVAIKEFVGLKPKMFSFLVDDNSEHKSKRCEKMLLKEQIIVNTKMFC